MADKYVYDVVVVGAGVHGSSAAYTLAKKMKKTLLLEQFLLPHTRGSSHGEHRIIRTAYGGKDFYTLMMLDAFKLWKEIERESGVTLYRKTGYLIIGNESNNYLKGTENSLRKHKIPFKLHKPEEFRKLYPFFSFPADVGALEDGSGGTLLADKTLRVLQDLFLKHGGVLHDGEEVQEIIPNTIVTVKTNKSTYLARNVVLTVGPWAPKVLRGLGLSLPLKVERMSVLYWKWKNSKALPNNILPFSQKAQNDFDTYGMRSASYPGLLKICMHEGPEIDPDERDKPNTMPVVEAMKQYIRQYFPDVFPEPVIEEACIYTNTVDGDFILDRHPKWQNIVIGAGFSGHGFKHGPVIGKLLAELTLNEALSHDISHFRIDRFQSKSKL